MAQITLRRARRRDDLSPVAAVSEAALADELPQRSYARGRWAARVIGLLIGALLAMALVSFRAVTSELEAVRWKLERAVDQERAQAMRLVREINATVNPATISRIVVTEKLTVDPAAVVHVKASKPLPPLRPTPVITPQPFAVSAAPAGGTQLVGALRAGVR